MHNCLDNDELIEIIKQLKTEIKTAKIDTCNETLLQTGQIYSNKNRQLCLQIEAGTKDCSKLVSSAIKSDVFEYCKSTKQNYKKTVMILDLLM